MVLGQQRYAGRQVPAEVDIAPLTGQNDIAAVARLYGAAFNEEPWPADWPDFAGFDAGGVFLARDRGELVGFVVSFVRPQRPDQGYISVVATAPSYRRRGIATALIHSAVERLWRRGCQEVMIDVAAQNLPARGAYEQCGFRVAQELVCEEEEAGQ